MRLRSPMLVFLILVASSLTGCGKEGGDVEQITDLTRQFAVDTRQKDWNAVCDAMSAKARASIAAGGELVGADDCPGIIGRAYELDDRPEELSGDVSVSNVKVMGDRATADVTPTFAGENPNLGYVREDGDWKLDYTVGAAGS